MDNQKEKVVFRSRISVLFFILAVLTVNLGYGQYEQCAPPRSGRQLYQEKRETIALWHILIDGYDGPITAWVAWENAGYPGGEEARQEYLSKNLKYPKTARRRGICGTVFVEFLVSRDGSISDVEVVNGIGGGCDEEAVRLAQEMPKWIPEWYGGRPVWVQITMPIEFKCKGIYSRFRDKLRNNNEYNFTSEHD